MYIEGVICHCNDPSFPCCLLALPQHAMWKLCISLYLTYRTWLQITKWLISNWSVLTLWKLEYLYILFTIHNIHFTFCIIKHNCPFVLSFILYLYLSPPKLVQKKADSLSTLGRGMNKTDLLGAVAASLSFPSSSQKWWICRQGVFLRSFWVT